MVRHAAAVALVLVLSPSWLSAQSTTFTVTAESADVHKGPSTGSVVIGHVVRGRTLVVQRELGSWVKVAWPEAEDGGGYLNVSWGSLGQKPVVAERAGTPATATAARGTAARGTVATSAPRSAAQPTASATPAPNAAAAEPRPAALRPVYNMPASHFIGVGGRMGNSPSGFGIGARAWRGNRFGIQIDGSRYAMTSAVTASKLTSMELEPSVVVGLHDSVGDYLWIRPYVGSGLMFRHQSLNTGLPGATATTSNGIGWQAFGGGELTFAGAPQFAVSADLGYRRLKTQVDGFDLGGMGLSLSAHWYIK